LFIIFPFHVYLTASGTAHPKKTQYNPKTHPDWAFEKTGFLWTLTFWASAYAYQRRHGLVKFHDARLLTVTSLSTDLGQHRSATLMCSTMLALSQTAA